MEIPAQRENVGVFLPACGALFTRMSFSFGQEPCDGCRRTTYSLHVEWAYFNNTTHIALPPRGAIHTERGMHHGKIYFPWYTRRGFTHI